ncbi:MAG: CBS domain-containing protein [Cyanothece sp. SIO2G6]|nr:CBS domain-containing protein [Cyanothece sp. SIO2G6]
MVDHEAKPVGLVTLEKLTSATQAGQEDMATVMQTDFPSVKESTNLEDIFQYCQARFPIAVVNDHDRFQGVVDPSAIFASIERLGCS